MLNSYATYNTLLNQLMAMQTMGHITQESKAGYFTVLKQSQLEYTNRRRSASGIKSRSRSLYGLDAARFFSSSSSDIENASGSDVEDNERSFHSPQDGREEYRRKTEEYQLHSSTTPESVLEGINKILEEKAGEMSNEEFFMFVSQVNRAASIATASVAKNLDGLEKLTEEIETRLGAEETPL